MKVFAFLIVFNLTFTAAFAHRVVAQATVSYPTQMPSGLLQLTTSTTLSPGQFTLQKPGSTLRTAANTFVSGQKYAEQLFNFGGGDNQFVILQEPGSPNQLAATGVGASNQVVFHLHWSDPTVPMVILSDISFKLPTFGPSGFTLAIGNLQADIFNPDVYAVINFPADQEINVSYSASFTTLTGTIIPLGSSVTVDLQQVPEPSAWALIVLGGIALFVCCRRTSVRYSKNPRLARLQAIHPQMRS